MVEEVVVKEALTNEMIEAGAELTRCLDGAHFAVSASLWSYLPDSNSWRLIIASSVAKISGPRKAYRKIQSVLNKIRDEEPTITLSNISVVEPKDRLVTLLKFAIKTVPGISGIRFSRNAIDGQFIEDVYVYRLT